MTLLNWQRCIEQIVVANKNYRVIGFTSVHRGSGVSLICRHVAKTTSVNGIKTLIISLSDTSPNQSRTSSDKPVAASALRAGIVPSTHGYDLLPGCDSEGRPVAFNIVQLRHVLDTEFADYNCIILDLPPISHVAADGLSTVAVSVVCDRTLLVCAIGADRRGEVSEAVALLRSAGATVTSVVSNEYKCADPWQNLFTIFSKRYFSIVAPARL
jgi:hypothetical protein